MKKCIFVFIFFTFLSSIFGQTAEDLEWSKELSAMRTRGNYLFSDKAAKKMWRKYPLQTDWFFQDNEKNYNWGYMVGYDPRGDFNYFFKKCRSNSFEKNLIKGVAKELGEDITIPHYKAGDSSWFVLYSKLCRKRRYQRLLPLLDKSEKIIYATHMNMGDIYLATETQSCPKGSQLRVLDLSPLREGRPLIDSLLFDSNNGIVRDPELSFDGKKLLFAWRKSREEVKTTGALAKPTGNYKIYEMELSSKKLRQLTDDSTYGADFEPCYLPNGDILFSSARIVQEVTCGWGDCSNFFLMNKDGKYARRIGFDQTQTAFPHILNDGQVVFTRRDYNDRGQTYAHSLFIMKIDGTNQTEFYGNNSCEPTSFQHTRAIPGSDKVISIAGGYHTKQGGKLLILDPKKGQQGYEGVEFINWDYKKKITANDMYGREGEQYQYPFALTEDHIIVSMAPIGGYLMSRNGYLNNSLEHELMRYKLYFMNLNGGRELLAADPVLSCTQGLPIQSRKVPEIATSTVDYRKNHGTMYVQDVYFGPAVEGVKKGSVKKIRVSKIFYKPVSIGGACWAPPLDQIGPGKKYSSFGQHSVTPVGVGTASFDAKEIIGEAIVHEDGSAMFEVPAREPIYLQLLDKDNQVIQSMRSWATLMPNESFSCVGCHEDNNSVPQGKSITTAMKNPPQKLMDFAGVSGRPFSYPKMVQPIFDKNCVSCHSPGKKGQQVDLTDAIVLDNHEERGYDSTRRRFYKSYLTLLKADNYRGSGKWRRLDVGRPNEWVDYYTRLLTVELVPPYYAGSATSGLIKMLREGHNGVELTADEISIICAWIDLNVPFVGEYDEMHDWDKKAIELYKTKNGLRNKMEEIDKENIKELIKIKKAQH